MNHFLPWAVVSSMADIHTAIYSFSALLVQAMVTVLVSETPATNQKQLKGMVYSDSVQGVPIHASGEVTVAGTWGSWSHQQSSFLSFLLTRT